MFNLGQLKPERENVDKGKLLYRRHLANASLPNKIDVLIFLYLNIYLFIVL